MVKKELVEELAAVAHEYARIKVRQFARYLAKLEPNSNAVEDDYLEWSQDFLEDENG